MEKKSSQFPLKNYVKHLLELYFLMQVSSFSVVRKIYGRVIKYGKSHRFRKHQSMKEIGQVRPYFFVLIQVSQKFVVT